MTTEPTQRPGRLVRYALLGLGALAALAVGLFFSTAFSVHFARDLLGDAGATIFAAGYGLASAGALLKLASMAADRLTVPADFAKAGEPAVVSERVVA